MNSNNNLWLRFLLIALIFVHTGCVQKEIAYFSLFDLKGRVKKVTSSRVDVFKVGDQWKKANRTIERTAYFFNAKGQILNIEFQSYDSLKKGYILSSSNAYLYDNKGLIKFTAYYNANGEIDTKFEVTKHDMNGLPIEEKLIEGNSVSLILSNYRPDAVERLSYNEDKKLVDKQTKVYDHAQIVTSESLIYFGDTNESNVIYTKKYSYLKFDKVGNWIERISMSGDSNEYSYIEEREINYW